MSTFLCKTQITCHGLLNLWLSCKVNGQVGSHAPKSGAAAGRARAFFYKVYRFLGGYTPKKHWILSRETGWSCSEFCTPTETPTSKNRSTSSAVPPAL